MWCIMLNVRTCLWHVSKVVVDNVFIISLLSESQLIRAEGTSVQISQRKALILFSEIEVDVSQLSDVRL